MNVIFLWNGFLFYLQCILINKSWSDVLREITLTIIDIYLLKKHFSDMIRNLNVHHATSNEIMVTWEPPQNNDVESYKVTR